METISNMQPGDWVELDHKTYSHIELTQEADGYTYGLRTRRSHRMDYPPHKTQWHEVKMWKTIQGARNAAIRFLQSK